MLCKLILPTIEAKCVSFVWVFLSPCILNLLSPSTDNHVFAAASCNWLCRECRSTRILASCMLCVGVAAGNNGALISHRPDFHLLNSISTLPGLLKKKGFNVGFRSKNNVVRSVSVPHLNGLSPNGSASHFLVDKTRRGSQTFSLSADDRSRLTAAGIPCMTSPDWLPLLSFLQLVCV